LKKGSLKMKHDIEVDGITLTLDTTVALVATVINSTPEQSLWRVCVNGIEVGFWSRLTTSEHAREDSAPAQPVKPYDKTPIEQRIMRFLSLNGQKTFHPAVIAYMIDADVEETTVALTHMKSSGAHPLMCSPDYVIAHGKSHRFHTYHFNGSHDPEHIDTLLANDIGVYLMGRKDAWFTHHDIANDLKEDKGLVYRTLTKMKNSGKYSIKSSMSAGIKRWAYRETINSRLWTRA
jgi:hypothetical protein